MQSFNRWLNGPTQEEKVRNWQQKLRSESRQLDREIRQLDASSAKAKQTLKQLATKGDVKSARILAKEVVRCKKQSTKLHTAKANLNSIGMALNQQLAMVKMAGTLQKSTEVMKASNGIIKLPQISATMREMSMEMMKAGIMEEMLEETMEMGEDEDEIEEEADAEVEGVLFELTNGKLGEIGTVKTALPTSDISEAEASQKLDSYRTALDEVLSS